MGKIIEVKIVKTIFSLGVGALLLALLAILTSSQAFAVSVNEAKISKGAIVVKGEDAFPNSDIEWEGILVTQADERGEYRFETIIPPVRDCTGRVSNLDEVVEVRIKKCDIRLSGMYTAAQTRTIVPEGEFASLNSACDLGDFVVSGQVVAFADDFRLLASGVVTDASTGIQTWGIRGINEGTEDADVRLAARCAAVVLRLPGDDDDDH